MLESSRPGGATVEAPPRARRWSIVLAGGDGTRLRAYVQGRFGDDRPKQYCAFWGRRSLLQHTLDRAGRLATPERTITIIGAAHQPWAAPQLAGHPGTVVTQRLNRETGPGVYLPLCWVRARDPDAIVYLLPSDHYVRPAERFVAALATAGDLAETHRDRIVVTGVTPQGPETDYGYVEPGEGLDPLGRVRHVRGFVEKPPAELAAAAIARGALWNTMVIAASVEALWQAGRACRPDMMSRFDELIAAIDTPFEPTALDAAYLSMPIVNFSREILERVPESLLLTRLDGVEWNDWGQAERIEATLARRGRRPARPAPVAHAHAAPAQIT
jgi:mannose-1-phosphate guanylyltransferase